VPTPENGPYGYWHDERITERLVTSLDFPDPWHAMREGLVDRARMRQRRRIRRRARRIRRREAP
jgi:hypothetical protein